MEGFINFSNGTFPKQEIRRTDAFKEFEYRFEETLSQLAVPVDTERLFPKEEAPDAVASYMRETELVLSLRPHDLMNLAIHLHATLSRIEQGKHAIDAQGELGGFKSGEAFGRFVGRCRAWAQGMNLPHGGYDADGKPSKLAAAVFEIAKLMPSELNPNINSVGAMAQHIKTQSHSQIVSNAVQYFRCLIAPDQCRPRCYVARIPNCFSGYATGRNSGQE